MYNEYYSKVLSVNMISFSLLYLFIKNGNFECHVVLTSFVEYFAG